MTSGGARRILEVTSYPPPRAGWGVRVEFLKKRLEEAGHQCVVLNIGTSRTIPSTEYEMVLGGVDFCRKVWRYSRQGFDVHAHANGDALKGLGLAFLAELISLLCGRRCYLTFHAGAIQQFFPRQRGRHLVPVFWLLFRIPRKIICNSQTVKDHIRAYGVRSEKIVAIPAFCREYLEFSRSELPPHLEAFFGQYASVIFSYVRMRPLFYPLTLIDGFALLAQRRPEVGLVLCGISGHMEQALWEEAQRRICDHQLESRICLVDDLDHDSFLTALERSAIYLRTPITDGVASSVLEAMSLGVPVVACENGTRPQGVICYAAESADEMATAVEYVLANRSAVIQGMANVEIRDTLAEEIAVLTS